jgi:stage II sporulation protein AA (anti-sigma F factor antagonist)
VPFETKQTDLASGVVVLAVSGSMTMGGELQRFEWQVERLIKENKNRLVLEGSQLTYLDSAGIGVLVKCSGLAKAAGGRLHLAAPTERVMNTLKMVSLDTLLAIDASLDAAVAALG